MSPLPTDNPSSASDPRPQIAAVIDGKARDLGGFSVARVLPSLGHRHVGPFIFFDHMGPAEFGPGHGIDVRPHPHIALETVTYLFEGEIIHKDSLGSDQAIRPGDINWMTAGSGIVHSERSSPELRKSGFKVEGLQLWVALPKEHEETDPTFHHHPAHTLPTLDLDGARIRVLAGTAYGVTSPVHTFSSLFYIDATLREGGTLSVPGEYAERALYVVTGSISCGSERVEHGKMWVFTPGTDVTLNAESDARVVLLGGAPLDGERYLEWNFVSSSKARLEQAKQDWKNGKFPKVPGDELEFIPLPQ